LQRVLTTVTLLGLLVATAAAFAITEHLKQIRSPVYGAIVSKIFSPVCHCATSNATIRVRLRHPDRVTLTVQDGAGHTVATIARGFRLPAREPHTFPWDGRTDSGALAPDGIYRPEIFLRNARRTILFPLVDRIVLDTKEPKVLSASRRRRIFSPGGHRTVAIRYAFSERAHPLVYVGNHRIIRGRHSRPHGTVKWAGKRNGRQVGPGTYVLSVGALDDAGNATPIAGRKQVTVVVRYLDLSRRRITVPAGSRFSVAVETESPRYTWRLGRRHGAAHRKVLRLRAPTKAGTYRLVVAEHGHAAVAVVKVRPK